MQVRVESGEIWSKESGFYIYCQGKLLEHFRLFKVKFLRLHGGWMVKGQE